MNLDKLRNFIFGMKSANRPQITGQLFVVDNKTGEICGCALGQGLIEAGVITEAEIRAETNKQPELDVYKDIHGVNHKGKFARKTSQKGYDWLMDNFGSSFAPYIYQQNDNGKSVLDIAMTAYQKYFGSHE